MRSQRRFENNAVWCERSEAALFETGVRKGAFYVGGLLLPREVFLEAYSSQKPQSATVRLSMWKGAPNNAEGKAKQCIGVMMSFCSILLRFLNHTFQNAEIRCSVWKQTEAHWNIAAAQRMNWKWSSVRSDCEFGDMKGVLGRSIQIFILCACPLDPLSLHSAI